MITLKKITTDEMLTECLDLAVSTEQENFVDSTAVSLALAWYNYDASRPFCIYHGDTMVGFVLLHCETATSCEIWQFLIDEKYQGKGYGSAALAEILQYAKNSNFEEIFLLMYPENKAAVKFYEKAGFYLTGKSQDEEVFMQFGG
ncbi:MAG: GNAT family N-acetyltransferase [Defluviitaleaceae bacterium]|nr:GNAT family N-acetyltransferase [Defluviitaleaceae bacterium]